MSISTGVDTNTSSSPDRGRAFT